MLNAEHIVQVGGLLAVGLIIFAESGILLGLFLPGDTLLLSAGLFAGQGKLSLGWLLAVIIFSAVIGYEVGYAFGERLGPKIFRRKDGILLRKDYINKTREFFLKYGPITVIAARFVAHVRTFVSIIAGAASMNRKLYFSCNVAGAVLWGGGLTLIGYWLGANVPNIDRYFFPFIIVGLVLIYSAVVWGLAKSPERRAALKKGLKEDWNYYFRSSDKGK